MSLGGCSFQSSDPRAVPGSNPNSTLDEILSKRGGYVADCQYDDLRYLDTTHKLAGRILIFVRVPSDCLDAALKGLGYPDDASDVLPTIYGENLGGLGPGGLDSDFARHFDKSIDLMRDRKYYLAGKIDCFVVEFDDAIDPAEIFVTCYQ